MMKLSDYKISWIIGHGGDRLDYRIQGQGQGRGGQWVINCSGEMCLDRSIQYQDQSSEAGRSA